MVFFSSRNVPFYFCLCMPPWQKRWKILQKYFFRTMLAIDSKNRQQFCSDAKHFAQICWIWQEYKENIFAFSQHSILLKLCKTCLRSGKYFSLQLFDGFSQSSFPTSLQRRKENCLCQRSPGSKCIYNVEGKNSTFTIDSWSEQWRM